MPFKDHFQTLRVSHRATPQQLQKAYYDRLKFFHPDYFQDDPPRRAIAESETKCLNEAFEVLGKPGERALYISEWERHHETHQPPERSLAIEQSLADARTNLNAARRQLAELKATLERRDRELEAANLGMRQSYQRVTHLQEAAQGFRQDAREIQERLQERELELRQAQSHGENLERQFVRLQADLDQHIADGLNARQAAADYLVRLEAAERRLAEKDQEMDLLKRRVPASLQPPLPWDYSGAPQSRVDPDSQREIDELRRALSQAESALGTRQAAAVAQSAESRRLLDEASAARQAALEQQDLLDAASNQIQVLRQQLREAQAAAVGSVPAASEADSRSIDLAAEVVRQRVLIQELSEALTRRTEEARLAQTQTNSKAGRAPSDVFSRREPASADSTAARPSPQAFERAARWLSPQRATTILTGLMLALCAVAVALVLLTVSIDLPALGSGLGRLGATLSGLVAR